MKEQGRVQNAVLILEDGTSYAGFAYGATGVAIGEVSVQTSLAGYQEILTSERVRDKLLLFTTPHIGNTGVNDEDLDSETIQAAGIIVRDPARRVSNFRAKRSLEEDLRSTNTIGIQGIDTRAITRRVSAAQHVWAGIFSGESVVTEAEMVEKIVSFKAGSKN